MTETLMLMGFLWVVGFLIACGTHDYTYTMKLKRTRPTHYLGLFFVWPHVIGLHVATHR